MGRIKIEKILERGEREEREEGGNVPNYSLSNILWIYQTHSFSSNLGAYHIKFRCLPY